MSDIAIENSSIPLKSTTFITSLNITSYGDMRKRIKRFLVGATLVAILGYSADECADEALFETEEEESLEQRWDMPINLNWNLRDEERSSRVTQLENSSNLARDNWDFYLQQFSNINYISITTGDSWYNPILGGLHYFCSEKAGLCDSDRDIMHELGHVWHLSLPIDERNRFDELWTNIGGENYRCSSLGYLLDNCDEIKDCGVRINDLAAVSCYGTKHLLEDIAEYFMFVYLINKNEDGYYQYSDYSQMDGMTIYYEAIPRIISHVQLLYQFGAFSEREYEYTVNQLLELSIIYQ